MAALLTNPLSTFAGSPAGAPWNASSALEAAEQERLSVGRILHERLCQNLSSLQLLARCTALSATKGHAVAAGELDELQKIIRHAVDDAHELAFSVRLVPRDPSGLLSYLSQLAIRTTQRVPCELVCHEPVSVHDPYVAHQLGAMAVGVVQREVSSGARRVVISLEETPAQLTLEIRSEGNTASARNGSPGTTTIGSLEYRAHLIGAVLSITAPETQVTVTSVHYPYSP